MLESFVDTPKDPTKQEGDTGSSVLVAVKSVNAAHSSYEERKISLARNGQLLPAFKHSSMKVPLTRVDRRGNEIGTDKKKFHITYIDQVEKKPLVQVHCVESYKKYNAEDPVQTDAPCCTIF